MSEYTSKEDISRVLLERIGANESCLIRAREKGLHESEQYFNNLLFEDGQITSLIEGLPSADVRPNIHARWTPITDSYYEDGTVKESHWECSKCGSGKSGWGEFKFCPDCGADMREPKDIIHKAIDNTIFAEEAYPNIKEELHKAVDMAEPKGEKGTE